ncbi:Peptidase family M1 [Prosthecobacter debontii]|uniref:Peptidase family M1 n=1 Tax=Prosthecobacter debontii TaxID=48467 RepID=A0A1T4WHI6_9BACT|nr:M1 family metallopeptidase [Prosthecobacter debontii]SKA76375.1 Peptidase family M1 [Prosthecobacter debontii]
MKHVLFFLLAVLPLMAGEPGLPVGKFQQLDQLLPTPSPQRIASGAPGKTYWQNRADYDIQVELDDVKRTITGEATVTYHNASPDTLTYLWVQLDQNYLSHNADSRSVPNTKRGVDLTKFSYKALDRLLAYEDYDGEMKILSLTNTQGHELPHTLVKTMLRLDLPEPLDAGQDFQFKIAWSYPINDCERINARTGYEFFKEDGNCIYTIAQWYPRVAAYTDYAGWINKQFLGTGEFTLEFGNYTVHLTVPDDHIVAATGALQNADVVLTEPQRERLKKAQGETQKPVFIVTPEEAKAAEKAQPKGKKTWVFQADNVRDFAFASSRKFIWDAMAVEGATHPPTPERKGGIADRMYRLPVMAMSVYPKEGMPLWEKYSTHAIAHTIQVYSKHTFAYPYPVAWSVNGPVFGMEYPMISFNGPRPEKDGTYPERTKYALIGVIIHEVGHNWFPMIVNSDERQWTWMDEGLNSFMEYLAEEAWENDWNHRRDERGMVDYMRLTERVPVMTNSESIADLGPNAYGQPTVALNLLREHVLGREAFDHAFKTYARRWMFKRPTPADFFRTLEDASGVDLDWFWRGWFYSVDHVDVSIDEVRWLQLDSRDPAIEKPKKKQEKDELPKTLTEERNASLPKRVDRFPELKDFYDSFDEASVLPSDKKKFESLIKELKEAEIDPALLKTSHNFYVIEMSNVGGLVTPVTLKLDYADGSTEEMNLPAEIWRFNTEKASKLLFTKKELKAATFDPRQELVDTDVENNFWPRRLVKSKFQLYKDEKAANPMREITKPEKDDDKKKETSEAKK